jgi:hypothetical protein
MDEFEANVPLSPAEKRQLLISIIGLCWFPFAHAPLVRDLGLEPFDPDFATERARHVTDLLLRTLGPKA